MILLFEACEPWGVTITGPQQPLEIGDSKASGKTDRGLEHVLTWELGDQVLTQVCR